jgi:dTDP-4-dehydrorhamnose reductase
MRVVITGAGGQLGRDLVALLPGAVGLDRQHLDLTDVAAMERALAEHRPELVFNAAADNAVDAAEADPGRSWRVNAEAPGRLARACARLEIPLVHFSTNYVFDGRAGEPYTEADRPNPLGAYARSKLEGERRVLAELPAALVVRSSGLFGLAGSAVKGGSFPERILARARSGAPLRVVSDQVLNPTFTRDLSEASIRLAGHHSGIVHVVADGCCSYHELALETLEQAGLEAPVQAIFSTDLPPGAAPRPLNGCLRSSRVPALRHWRDGLSDYLTALLNNAH